MEHCINIAIVDDQQLFRQGLAALISRESSFRLLFEAANGLEFIQKMEQDPGRLPDVVLLDIEMPEMDGTALNSHIQQNFPGIKTIMLSIHAAPRLIARMIHNGTSGYLQKNCDQDELLTAIRSCYKNGFYMNPDTMKALQLVGNSGIKTENNAGIAISLTKREQEILQLICKEYTNAEIAEQLFVSQRTVDGHRNNLLLKTGCRNTAGLVLFAVKHHIHELL